jgi:molecular chaperone DnaK
MNATPLYLGIEISTGGFAKVIPRNYMFPTRISIIVSTTEDNQETAITRISEGARETALENRELCTQRLTTLPRKPKGVLKINIYFEVNIDEVLIVSTS